MSRLKSGTGAARVQDNPVAGEIARSLANSQWNMAVPRRRLDGGVPRKAQT
jgi:hypothetical protein